MYQDSSVSGFLKERVSASMEAVNSAAASETGYVAELRYTPELLRFFAQTNQLGLNDTDFFQAQYLLPETISSESDKQVYLSFVDRFGTHIGRQWQSGGGLAQFEMTNMSLVQKMNETWAARQSSFGLTIIVVSVGFMSAHVHAKADMSMEFRENTHNVLVAVGGNPLLLEAGGTNMLGWNASIFQAPAPFNTTSFINMSQLIVDEGKRNNMQMIVDEYMQKGRTMINPFADLANLTCGAPPGANLSFSQIPDPVNPPIDCRVLGACGQDDRDESSAGSLRRQGACKPCWQETVGFEDSVPNVCNLAGAGGTLCAAMATKLG